MVRLRRRFGCAVLVLAGCAGILRRFERCAGGAILGGNATPSIATGAASTLASIVIELGADEIALCSGVMLSDRALLTARHCLETTTSDPTTKPVASTPAQITIFIGDPLDEGAPAATVGAIARHETLDVALLSLDFHGRAPVITPVPLLEGALDDSWIGARVELAGYGVVDSGDAGILSFATETIARLEPDHVVVTGQGESGACVGDSGGPLFGTTPDGRVRVLGLLDDGAASCLGLDRYTRVDRIADWAPLASALEQVAPTGAACGAAP